jgi:hypothetical protein
VHQRDLARRPAETEETDARPHAQRVGKSDGVRARMFRSAAVGAVGLAGSGREASVFSIGAA